MSYQGRQVIVTGGTGALGAAVVGALIEAGATCYVPWRHEAEVERFAYRAARPGQAFRQRRSYR